MRYSKACGKVAELPGKGILANGQRTGLVWSSGRSSVGYCRGSTLEAAIRMPLFLPRYDIALRFREV